MAGRREGGRILLSAAAFTLVLVSLVAYASGADLGGLAVRAGVLVFGLGLYGLYWRVSRRVHTASHPASHTHEILDDAQVVRERLDSGVLTYGADELLEAIELLADPRSRVERITEQATPNSRSLALSTSLTVRLAAAPSARVVAVPIILIERGQLQDGLRIFGASGERVSSLTRADSAYYVGSLIRSLVERVGVHASAEYRDKLELDVLNLLCSNVPLAPKEVERITDAIFLLGGDASKMVSLFSACQIIRTLHLRYPIFLEHTVPANESGLLGQGPQLRFSIHRRVVTLLKRKSGALAFIRDESRKLLGIRPSVLSVPLFNATRAGSYHLQVSGPEGTYLASQRIVDLDGTESDLSAARYAIRARLGQRHSHVYVRSSDDSFAERQFENHFYERVPGSVGYATMSAFTAAALVAVIAVLRLGFARGGGSDLVLALLALPAIAGTWLGIGDSGGLSGGTLAARVSNIATVVSCLGSAAAFVLTPDIDHILHGSIHDRPYAPLWILLAGGSILNFVAIAGSWLLRATVQRDLISRAE